MIHS
jgi:hypothetical protein